MKIINLIIDLYGEFTQNSRGTVLRYGRKQRVCDTRKQRRAQMRCAVIRG